MQDQELGMIVVSNRALPLFSVGNQMQVDKEAALTKAALIAKVTGHDSKVIAVRAQQDLKRVISAIEKARKEMKEPLLVAGRQLDTLCATESTELEKEFGRVSNAVKEFDDAERRRVQEEERLQQAELARIEREKQAELDRIAREQAAREAEARRIQEEADRVVREAQEAAAKAARDATNKKEREAAQALLKAAAVREEAARVERERQDALTREQQARVAIETAAVQEKSGDAAFCASRPIEITRVEGQRTTNDWKITKINDWALAKARPDLVRKIEFDMLAVKAELRKGTKLPGVEAEEVYSAGVKLPPQRAAIEV